MRVQKDELFNPAVLKQLCLEYNLNPSKKYGQNYLITDRPIREMIDAASIDSSDVVIEIGPGFGVLTLALVEKTKRVIAFEIEKKLQSYWEEQEKVRDNLDVIWGNALKEVPKFVDHLSVETYKVVANLPYQITSAVFRLFLEQLEKKPSQVITMVQKEVAERICAKPGDMSLLAVSVQYYGVPSIVTKVSRGSFWPSPDVDSAVLSISNIQTPSHVFSDDYFFTVVKAGFAQKRKQLWRNISKGMSVDGDHVKEVLKEVVGNEKVRAEELSVDQWVNVIKALKH